MGRSQVVIVNIWCWSSKELCR